jgi:chromosome partitioning protein
MKNIAFYNHKGGVGKTTSVINIAYNLQKAGKTVLVVDCDSQKNSFGFFFQEGKNAPFRPTKYPLVSLTTWEALINSPKIRIVGGDEESPFDYIIFDLPPAMTDEVRRIIGLSDVVFVPTMLGEFEIAGLSDVTEEILKQGSKLGGVFVTMFNKKNDYLIFEEFKGYLKNRLMNTIIPFSHTVRESQKAGLSLDEYFDQRQVPNNPNSRQAAVAYEKLTAEILGRCE